MHLKNKVVFLTGGTSGIGSACAKVLLQRGAKVVITGRNEDAGLKQADVFKKEFGKDHIHFIRFDVSKEKEFEAAIHEAEKEFGYIDAIINNAGILDEDNWSGTLDTNVKGVIYGSELARARMRKDKEGGRGGVIINMASFVAYTPFYVMPVYTASKYAVIGYTRSMAHAPDVAALGIRYACVCPNLVDTPMVRSATMKTRAEYRVDVPGLMPKELVLPSDVGEAVVTLLEDDSSNDAVVEVTVEGAVRRNFIVQ